MESIDIYRKYQENAKKTELLQAEILKGLERGENLAALFLKAMKALSLCTDNSILYSQAEQDIRIVYGLALHEPAAQEQAEAETRERLEKLRALRADSTDDETCKRLDIAIAMHVKQLKNMGKEA